MQPERRVGQHRKERHDPGADQHRRRLRHIDQQQRRDRNHRRYLQDHRIGIKRIFDQARQVEQHGEAKAAERGQHKALDGSDQRYQQRLQQQRTGPSPASAATRLGDGST